jgi:hypothetical protein
MSNTKHSTISEVPAQRLHEAFQVDAWDLEMGADIRDLCRVRFELLFGNDGALVDAGTGDDKGIGYGNAHQTLPLADQGLKV